MLHVGHPCRGPIAKDEVILPMVRICSAKKLSLVGNGIATAYFADGVEPATLPGPGRSEGAARRADKGPVVLMVSRLVREKGATIFCPWPAVLRVRPASSTLVRSNRTNVMRSRHPKWPRPPTS